MHQEGSAPGVTLRFDGQTRVGPGPRGDESPTSSKSRRTRPQGPGTVRRESVSEVGSSVFFDSHQLLQMDVLNSKVC